MQRLAKPSDYVRQEVLGQSTYVLPWETRLCPGNPADDPEMGASLYNEFAQEQARGLQPGSPLQQLTDIIEWTVATPGEEARNLAADLAQAYQGKYRFVLDGLDQWDMETKAHRAHLVFHNDDIQRISAQVVMDLRIRAGKS